MSNRRMFSNRIGNSAKFLQMPSESQLLYFHLVLRADDDGVVESYPLLKMLGVPPDVFKVLLAKGYIKQINEDQVIVILDWLEHNKIRADRKVDSIYKHLLPENIKTIEAKPRSDVKNNSARLSGQSTDGISKVKLSKVKLSKVNTDGISLASKNEDLNYAFSKWNEHLTHNGFCKNTTARIRLFPECRKITSDIERIFGNINNYSQDEILASMKNYATDIINRDPKNDYAKHRFSFYEFFSQKNGFKKFLNK